MSTFHPPYPSLLPHAIQSQAPEALVIAKQLFATGEVDVARMNDRLATPNTMDQAFRLVLADAIAQQGVKALIDGRTLREVGTLMSKGLKALPLEDMAYGVGAFMATVQAYGKHQLKHLVDPGFSPLNKDRLRELGLGLDEHLISAEQRDVMIRSVSKYPSLVSDQHALEAAEQALKTAILGTATPDDPSGEPSPDGVPLGTFLHCLVQVQTNEAQHAVQSLFAHGNVGPRPVLRDNDPDSSAARTAMGYALADVIAEQAAQALEQGRTLQDVGQLVGKGLTTLTPTHFVYGIDALKQVVVAHQKEWSVLGTGGDALQNLNGLIKADSSRLSPTAMRDLTMSIDGTLSSRYGHDLLVQAMTDRDKGLDPSGFATVTQAFFQEREGRAQLFRERDLLVAALSDSPVVVRRFPRSVL